MPINFYNKKENQKLKKLMDNTKTEKTNAISILLKRELKLQTTIKLLKMKILSKENYSKMVLQPLVLMVDFYNSMMEVF